MIDETLRRLEERIRSADDTRPETREALLALVTHLRAELTVIAESHGEDALSLARQAHDAATGSGAGVEDTMREFESAHPKTVALVRSLLRTLADAGI